MQLLKPVGFDDVQVLTKRVADAYEAECATHDEPAQITADTLHVVRTALTVVTVVLNMDQLPGGINDDDFRLIAINIFIHIDNPEKAKSTMPSDVLIHRACQIIAQEALGPEANNSHLKWEFDWEPLEAVIVTVAC